MKVKGQVESTCEEDDIELEDDKGPEDEHDVLLVVEFGFGVEFAMQADFGNHEESGEWLIIVRFSVLNILLRLCMLAMCGLGIRFERCVLNVLTRLYIMWWLFGYYKLES